VLTTLRYVFDKDEDKTFDCLRRLDANVDQYIKSGAAGGMSVAIGEPGPRVGC
jgi:iron(III) transport system substrate-binding protein